MDLNKWKVVPRKGGLDTNVHTPINGTSMQHKFMKSLKERIKDINELRDIQGESGNWDHDDYMCGMYNGMELIIATLENREPIHKTLSKENKE